MLVALFFGLANLSPGVHFASNKIWGFPLFHRVESVVVEIDLVRTEDLAPEGLVHG